MQYSVPRDQRSFEQPKVLSDWICAKVRPETTIPVFPTDLLLLLLSAGSRTSGGARRVSSVALPRRSSTRPATRRTRSAATPPTVSLSSPPHSQRYSSSSHCSCPAERPGRPHHGGLSPQHPRSSHHSSPQVSQDRARPDDSAEQGGLLRGDELCGGQHVPPQSTHSGLPHH